MLRRGSSTRGEPLPPPVRRVQLCVREDLPAALDPERVYVINGGTRLGPECPVEPCCSFTVPVLLTLTEIGIEYTEYVMDLGDKPTWLAEVIGEPADYNLTTPMMAYRGVWYTDSTQMLAMMPSMCSDDATRTVLFTPPPHLPLEAMGALGMQAMMTLISSPPWDVPADHPLLPILLPLEKALEAAPCLSGHDAVCAADLRAGAWVEILKQLDLLFSSTPLDWQEALPRATAWLEQSIVPRIRATTSYGRRVRMLLSVVLSSKMPQLASRISPAIAQEVKATVELARVSARGGFAI